MDPEHEKYWMPVDLYVGVPWHVEHSSAGCTLAQKRSSAAQQALLHACWSLASAFQHLHSVCAGSERALTALWCAGGAEHAVLHLLYARSGPSQAGLLAAPAAQASLAALGSLLLCSSIPSSCPPEQSACLLLSYLCHVSSHTCAAGHSPQDLALRLFQGASSGA